MSGGGDGDGLWWWRGSRIRTESGAWFVLLILARLQELLLADSQPHFEVSGTILLRA